MTVKVVVGAQYGDEGKGRIVDYLAQDADMVVRFQGGDNAGHTVVNEFGKFALHMIPSGIFNPQIVNVVGTGCVVNPVALKAEMETLEAANIDTSKLLISNRAQMLMPYHLELDRLEEEVREEGQKNRYD
jgi:adenylosuccinate synthase